MKDSDFYYLFYDLYLLSVPGSAWHFQAPVKTQTQPALNFSFVFPTPWAWIPTWDACTGWDMMIDALEFRREENN